MLPHWFQFVPAIALTVLPQPTNVLREHCTEIEVNVFFDEEGREVFTQAIFRNDDHSIRAWRLVKVPNQIPLRDWEGGFKATWMDGEILRCVTANNVQWTWTQFDRELVERDEYPKENRKGLREPPVKYSEPPSGAIRPQERRRAGK